MNQGRRRPGGFVRSLAAAAVTAALTVGAACSDGGGGAGAGGASGSGATGGVPETGGASGTSGGAGGAGGVSATGRGGAAGGAIGGSGAAGGAGTVGGASGGADASGGGSRAAGGTTATGGTGGATATGGTGGSFAAVDEFDGAALAPAWTVLRPDLADLVVAGGTLSLTPHGGALWYQASQSVLVYKLVTGDFKVTATVHARRASNPAETPNQFADVGGLMGRNPGGSSENYVLGVVGYAEMNQLAVENKSTTNSKSVYGETPFGADAELRLCRMGATFTIYYRAPGSTGWPTSVAPITRADLPATLQVGMIAYTGVQNPDYVSIFDRVAFEPVGAGCDR